MLIQQFEASADFGLFKDPSASSSPTTYVIPPKSAIIGLLGAMIGLPREGTLDYSDGYRKLLTDTKIGIKVVSPPKKFSTTVNHVALKAKNTLTKPTKMEYLVNPRYQICFNTAEEYSKRLDDALTKNQFVFTPHLGHAYCLARINNYEKFEATETSSIDEFNTSFVAVEPFSETTGKRCLTARIKNGKMIIERQLFHEISGGQLKKTVLKHYAPIGNGTETPTIRITLKENSPKLVFCSKNDCNIVLY